MSKRLMFLVFWLAVAPCAVAGTAHAKHAAPPLDTAKIEQLTGAKGSLSAAEGVFKVSVPRTDLALTIRGVRVTPAMGLTSWAAFQPMGGHVMVMGDTVLTEDQVNPVMDAALANGLEVTALHNHFFWDEPKVMFMHIGGTGETDALASAVGKVFAAIRDTSGAHTDPLRVDIDPARTSLEPGKIESVLGVKGELKAGVYKVVLGRTTTMEGGRVGNAMGVNTWAAFAGSNDSAVVDGDFAMLESELQGVLKALRAARINVVAIHQHMTGDRPRMLFLHYWGIGRTDDLARGLRAALDRTALRVASLRQAITIR